MNVFLVLAALLPVAFCMDPIDGQTCTNVIITGDEADAECTCTCVCEADCPTTEPMGSTTEAFTMGVTIKAPLTSVPPADGCCYAGKSGKDLLDTYDGNQFQFLTNNKFIVSRGGEGTDQCKFQVRVDTDKDRDGVFVSWVGVAYGVHLGDDDDYDRNFRISLRSDPVEIRGRGFKKPKRADPGVDYSTGPNPDPWTFSYIIDADGCFVVTGAVPAQGCSVEVTYCENAGPDGNDYVKIRPPQKYIGNLIGMCGNFDMDPANDDQFCPGLTDDISDNCIEGKHQGNDSRF